MKGTAGRKSNCGSLIGYDKLENNENTLIMADDMNYNLTEYKKINGNTLKIIACIVMVLDHATAGIIIPVVSEGLYPDSISFEEIEFVYDILRMIGRNSFPIFCFLLVEGFIHTSSRLRYALSLLVFGLISEPFYDAILNTKEDPFNPNFIELIKANAPYLNDHCNVFFTLLMGLLAIWAIEKIFSLRLPFEVKFMLSAASSSCFVFLAEKVHSDYHGFGVGLIIVFYVLRMYEPINLVTGYCLISLLGREDAALPCFILLYFYNKKRGRKLGPLKYLFYAFYPIHIYIIYLVRCLMYG
jgi:hypothetical protein